MSVDEQTDRSRRAARPASRHAWPAGLLGARLADGTTDLDPRGFHLFPGRRLASGGGPVAASQPDLAGLHAVGGPVPGLDLRRPDHAAPAERVSGACPAYVFSGDPLVIDYTLENGRRWYAALAVFIEDSLVPVDRSVAGAVER